MENRLLEFKNNILTWYPFNKDTSILNLDFSFNGIIEKLNNEFSKIVSIENTFSVHDNSFSCYNSEKNINESINIENEKFDYILLIGEYTYDYYKKLEFAKFHLKEDGKILLSLDNKLGLRNWNQSSSLNKNLSQNELIELFNKLEINNSKFYFVFPSYKDANFIYTNDYKITLEDISRNFSVYDKDSVVSLNENQIYKKLFDEDKNILNKFANSFFIELSNSKIETDIKYVSFTNYRKKEYRTMTIINNNSVIKKAADIDAKKHISNMASNLDELKNYNVKVIEKYENDELISDFIQSKRFDDELNSSNSIDEFFDKVKILFDVLSKDSIDYKEAINEKIQFIDCIKNYNKNKLEKLHFVRKGFIDLIPKNCFLINGELNVFDQEWVVENVPLEYIFYRVILNTNTIVSRFGKENLLNKINLIDYIDLFQQLESKLEDKIADKELLSIFFRKYTQTKEVEIERNIYKEKAFEYLDCIEKIEKDNESLNIQLETAKTNLVNYANQLRVISNSKSWKILQKITAILKFINIFDGRTMFDRLHPIGSESRNKIELQKSIDKENKRLEIIKNATDEETFEYWKNLELKYNKRKDELSKKEITKESDPYEFWAKANDPTEEELKNQRIIAENFAIKPKISILIPLYNTKIDFFRELLYSLVCQTYSNWELCLADGSENRLTEIENICKDTRIKYTYIGENKGISGNTNEALKLATGDYISLFDHDDLLPFNSLFEIIKSINENPNAEFIYTDEDKIISIDEARYDPHFKPDYSPDFLMSENYICHFSTFKKSIMDKVQGFRNEYDGAQDYDIILRAVEAIEDKNNIIHIPKILYHWRIHPGSTAGNSEAKLYAFEAGRRAVADHVKRMNYNAEVKENEDVHGIYDVYYKLVNNPKISIIIQNKNDLFNLKSCVNSIIEKTTYTNYEIIIIDINSDNYELLNYYDNILNDKVKVLKYTENDNVNRAKLMNWAIKQITCDLIIELDKFEILQTPNWLDIMGGLAQREDVGLVSPKIYYNDGRIKSTGLVYGNEIFSNYLYRGFRGGFRSRDILTYDFSALSSICRIYKKELFDKIGGYSEEFTNELVNEVDFSFKFRNLGYLNVYTPKVNFIDIDPYDTRNNVKDIDIFNYKNEIKELKQKWNSFYTKPDPYHNINFNPLSNICTIRIDKVN